MNDILLSAYVRAYGLRGSVLSTVRRRLASIAPEGGQDLVEYAVLVGLIGVVAAGALVAFGGLDFPAFRTKINDCITFDPGCVP